MASFSSPSSLSQLFSGPGTSFFSSIFHSDFSAYASNVPCSSHSSISGKILSFLDLFSNIRFSTFFPLFAVALLYQVLLPITTALRFSVFHVAKNERRYIREDLKQRLQRRSYNGCILLWRRSGC